MPLVSATDDVKNYVVSLVRAYKCKELSLMYHYLDLLKKCGVVSDFIFPNGNKDIAICLCGVWYSTSRELKNDAYLLKFDPLMRYVLFRLCLVVELEPLKVLKDLL